MTGQPLCTSANHFALDLYQSFLNRHGDKYKNLVLCPYLIYQSLAMMLVGARGNTARQLMKVLRIQENSDAGPSEASLTKLESASSKIRFLTRSPSSCSSSASGVSSSSSTKSLSRKRGCTKSEKSIGPSAEKTKEELRHREFLLLTEQLLHGNHDFVHLASFVYLDKGTKRTEKFKNILRDFYETKPKKIDFENVDLMVKTINEDVARTTENIYHDILPRAEAQKLEKSYMLLVNAVFFRGFWLSNFTDVKEGVFVGSQEFKVNIMSKIDYLAIVHDDDLSAQMIKMPFEASDLEMLIILPDELKSDSKYLCQKLTASKIDNIIERFNKTKPMTTKVLMPIFCIDSGKISIQSTLVAMGSEDLFDKNKADMSGVCENKAVWLHKILHRCFIICDNRGSITSSNFEKALRRKTRLERGPSSGRQGVAEFVANHPFIYIIMDHVTKTILMMGMYTSPSETLEVVHENQLSPEEAHQIYTEGVYKTD